MGPSGQDKAKTGQDKADTSQRTGAKQDKTNASQDKTSDVLQGTLDMLILKAVSLGPLHGYGVLLRIQQISGEELVIQQGSLYPALYRLEHQGAIASSWGESENNRRAKYYRLTKLGRERLGEETEKWKRMSGIINGILRTTPEKA